MAIDMPLAELIYIAPLALTDALMASDLTLTAPLALTAISVPSD